MLTWMYAMMQLQRVNLKDVVQSKSSKVWNVKTENLNSSGFIQRLGLHTYSRQHHGTDGVGCRSIAGGKSSKDEHN